MVGGRSRGGKPDNDGFVAGGHEVNSDALQKGGELFCGKPAHKRQFLVGNHLHNVAQAYVKGQFALLTDTGDHIIFLVPTETIFLTPLKA